MQAERIYEIKIFYDLLHNRILMLKTVRLRLHKLTTFEYFTNSLNLFSQCCQYFSRKFTNVIIELNTSLFPRNTTNLLLLARKARAPSCKLELVNFIPTNVGISSLRDSRNWPICTEKSPVYLQVHCILLRA